MRWREDAELCVCEGVWAVEGVWIRRLAVHTLAQPWWLYGCAVEWDVLCAMVSGNGGGDCGGCTTEWWQARWCSGG